MLPLEAHLLAAGWPRRGAAAGAAAGAGVRAAEGGSEAEGEGEGGSRACRLLFMARRAERQLMSYERAG